MPAKKKKVVSAAEKARRARDLANWYYAENRSLRAQLQEAQQKIEELSKFDNLIMQKRESYSQLERRCKEAEWAKERIVSELVEQLNNEQIEAAKLSTYPPERYALELFKILKTEQGNIERKLRNGVT